MGHCAVEISGCGRLVNIGTCVARYSFIQLSELWQRGVNEIAKALNPRTRTRILSNKSPMF